MDNNNRRALGEERQMLFDEDMRYELAAISRAFAHSGHRIS